ncbi:MAG TPA: LysR family transcriptional regulator [Nevskiaceae bacterium]|nr:LysR family transcriptional regulator [Nevskiaceae bacterium]
MDRFALMQCFVRAVETGSFSAVARELDITQPTVSRNVALLEGHLGVRLLHRSTRRMTLTPEGESYYAECRRILDAIAEADASARGTRKAAGLLRVSCPSALARHRLMPLLPGFTAAHPDVTLELIFSNRDPDLIAEGIDVAVRLGRLADSTHRARLVATYAMCCAASPAYLERHGRPQRPADLLEHNCIIYTRASTGLTWTLGEETVRPRGNLRVDNAEGIRAAVLSDMGIVMAPTWLFADELHDGRLQCLLTDYPIAAIPVYLLYPAQRFVAVRARAFMDYVADAFRRDPCFNGDAVDQLGLTPCARALRAAAVE